MPITTTSVFIGVASIAATVWLERRKWRDKPREELVAMASGKEWRYWRHSIRELMRRGEDVRPYLRSVAGYLVDEKRMPREAARSVLADLLPGAKQQLSNAKFNGADEPAVSREKLTGFYRWLENLSAGDGAN